ncbi:MAG TPA: DUF1800 domain-containing protein [Ktedonobacterales bacterium]|jgi:uncharacterized protein (DUF1800 family)|nr:DUF1800 domain-containing protein [Ktedonobacterales bacterium]
MSRDNGDYPFYDPSDGQEIPYAPIPDMSPTRISLGGRGVTGVQETPPQQKKRGISRRTVLIGAGVGAVGLGAAGAGLGAFLLQHKDSPATANLLTTDTAKVNHLLRRAGFGPTPTDLGQYLALGLSDAVDRLLNFSSVQDDLNSRLAAQNFDQTNPTELMREWLLRMIYSKRPLEEKMTLFWHGVLTSSFRDVGGKTHIYYMKQQNDLLRKMGMGRFDDLMDAITVDPAMLHYLNGNQSTGNSPNENYARELMELFTMGIQDAKGNDNYSQTDVHQGALALAGWVEKDGKSQFVPNRAYKGQVTYLGHTGVLEMKDVIQLVCAHPSTGRHLAYRMWSFFVYENPSDSDLQPLADAYYKSNHNIGAMVKAMFTSPAFFSDKAYKARIKSPVEFVVGAVRGLGLETDGKKLPQAIAAMGQTIYDPPNVSGWDGDKMSSEWLSTQTWMTRVNFINSLVAASGGATTKGGDTSGTALQKLITDHQLKTPDEVLDFHIATLADSHLADDRRALLSTTLTQGATTGPSLTLAGGGGKLSALRLRETLYTMMSLPEYQMN